MLSLILVQVPFFQSWKWLMICFSECKWVRVVPQRSWTTLTKQLLQFIEHIWYIEQFVFYLVIFNPQNNLQDRYFPPFLKEAEPMEFEPWWSIWLQSPFLLSSVPSKSKKCFAPLLFKYPNHLCKETHWNIKLPHRAKLYAKLKGPKQEL